MATARALIEAPNAAALANILKQILDKPQKVGHNKDAATDKPRTRWETGKQ